MEVINNLTLSLLFAVFSMTIAGCGGGGDGGSQNVQAPSTRTYTPGQSVIDLGSLGKLIHPVSVAGKWYYHWDRSGDGTIAEIGTLNGGIDRMSHRQLKDYFTQDVNGNTVAGEISDTRRYGTLDGVRLALPTLGGGTGVGVFQAGTADG